MSITRDRHAENRVFIKRLYGQKLSFGGCKACFSDLETIFQKFKNFNFRSKIYDFLNFFRNSALTSDHKRSQARHIAQMKEQKLFYKIQVSKSCGKLRFVQNLDLNHGGSGIFLAKFS